MISVYARIAAGVGIAAAAGGIWWHGYNYAENKIVAAHQAQMGQQIAKAASDMYAMVERSAELERLKNLQLDLIEAQLSEAEREVQKYAKGPAKKCVVSPEFVRAADAATRVLHADVPAERVPPTADASNVYREEASPLLDGRIPTPNADGAQVRMTDSVALFALNDCSAKLAHLWTEYESRETWAEEMYQMQLEAAGRTILTQ